MRVGGISKGAVMQVALMHLGRAKDLNGAPSLTSLVYQDVFIICMFKLSYLFHA